MFDTLLLRPSLHCNTPLHFTTLHPTTLHYTSLHFTQLHFTSSHLHFTTLSFSFTHLHFLSFYLTSHHINRYHPQNYFQKSKLFHCLKELLTISLHFTFYFIYLFIVYLSYQPYTSLYFAVPNNNLLPFTSLPSTFYFLSPLLLLTGLHFPNPRFENMRFTLGSPFR